jgi:hypothetical protein
MWLFAPGRANADDGFWVTVASGVSGSNTPSDYSEFHFDSPHAPIVVNQLTGISTAQATTAGGTTFFGGAGTPILLPTTDGYATLTPQGGPTPSAALPRHSGAQASGAPQTGVPPSGLNLLNVDLGTPNGNGGRVLSVGATDANGNSLGSGHVTVPTGGWFVIGLGTGALDTPPDPVDNPPPPVPDPPPVTDPPPPVRDPGTVTTPEPASAMLLGVGGLAAASWRRIRRR